MRLYYGPGYCSLACHIALEESGLNYVAEVVDFENKKNETPDFLKLNALGAVPVLVMDNGQPLTEGATIMQFIADQKTEAKLMPAHGTIENFRAREWLNFIATELQASFGRLFGADRYVTTPDAKETYMKTAIDTLTERLDVAEHRLANNNYCIGDQFTVADGYLFTVISWAGHVNVKMDNWPKLKAHHDRVKARPAVQRVLRAEGLLEG